MPITDPIKKKQSNDRYREGQKEELRVKRKLYYENNKEKIKAKARKYRKIYYKKNRREIIEQVTARYRRKKEGLDKQKRIR